MISAQYNPELYLHRTYLDKGCVKFTIYRLYIWNSISCRKYSLITLETRKIWFNIKSQEIQAFNFGIKLYCYMLMIFSTEGAEHLGIMSVKSNSLNHWFSSLVVYVGGLKEKSISGPHPQRLWYNWPGCDLGLGAFTLGDFKGPVKVERCCCKQTNILLLKWFHIDQDIPATAKIFNTINKR